MSLSSNERTKVDRRVLDRLVDGELAEAERTALLLRLETEPDGWRCCALAFLEAQAWRDAFSPLSARSAPDRIAAMPAATGGKSPRVTASASSGTFRTIGAIAAGLLVAFLSGLAIGNAGHSTQKGSEIASRAAGVEMNVAERRALSADVLRHDERSQADAAESPESADPSISDERWLSQLPPSLPAPVLRRLERQGYEVEQRRGSVSMDLQDGRRLDVPVDEVKLQFVGGQTY